MKERGKITCYIAMSLDGYIAREDGNVDWLPAIGEQEDYGYYEFLSTIDGIVVGNSTYEQFIKGQAYPFGNRPCYVFSHEDEEAHGNVQYMKQPIAEFVDSLRQRENENLWLMGGATIIAGFLVADAVDELMVTILPIVLGNGIPLFIPGIPESLWKLKGTLVYPHGIVQLKYVLET
jgi:dihydrofolate reductase